MSQTVDDTQTYQAFPDRKELSGSSPDGRGHGGRERETGKNWNGVDRADTVLSLFSVEVDF
jgi:hypothetical protein